MTDLIIIILLFGGLILVGFGIHCDKMGLVIAGLISFVLTLPTLIVGSWIEYNHPTTYEVNNITTYMAEDGANIYKVLIREGQNKYTYILLNDKEFESIEYDGETMILSPRDIENYEQIR